MTTIRKKERRFEEIFYNTKDKVYGFVKKILGDHHLVEDCMQLCYVRFWQKMDDIDLEKDTLPLLFVYARNFAIDELRKSRTNRTHEEISNADRVPDVSGTEELLNLRHTEKKLSTLMETMPERRRQVFKLIKIEGFSHKETAMELNISQSTVEKHIMEASKYVSPEKLL